MIKNVSIYIKDDKPNFFELNGLLVNNKEEKTTVTVNEIKVKGNEVRVILSNGETLIYRNLPFSYVEAK